MTLPAYALSAVIAFSGVLAGAVLASRTPEELPAAEKYLPRLQQVILIAITGFFVYSFRPGILIAVLLSGLAFFMILLRPKLNYYPFLAVIFFLSGQNAPGLFAVSALVFLYGLPTGSLYFIKNRNAGMPEILKKTALKCGVFLLISLGFQLLYSAFILKNLF